LGWYQKKGTRGIDDYDLGEGQDLKGGVVV